MTPHFGYVRVSSFDQNVERQLADLDVKLDKTFTDKCYGKNTKRPELRNALEYIREGDVLHVHSVDRLTGRKPALTPEQVTEIKMRVTQREKVVVRLVSIK